MLNSVNFNLSDCECGVTLDFPNPSGTLHKKDEYLVYFSLQSSLPNDPPSIITLNPASYVMSGTNDFIPKIIAKVMSVHRGQTQSLIRLEIKDRFNQLLHSDYIKLVCAPQSTVIVKGTILTGNNNIGLNGGVLMNVTSTAELDVGMQVIGLGALVGIYILTIVSDTQIELSGVPQSPPSTLTNYTFTRTTNCVDPATLKKRENQSQYVVLDVSNNWTYKFSDKIILQFFREDLEDESISIIVPAKNKTIMPADNKKTDIPSLAIVYASGRVNNDQYCIT